MRTRILLPVLLSIFALALLALAPTASASRPVVKSLKPQIAKVFAGPVYPEKNRVGLAAKVYRAHGVKIRYQGATQPAIRSDVIRSHYYISVPRDSSGCYRFTVIAHNKAGSTQKSATKCYKPDRSAALAKPQIKKVDAYVRGKHIVVVAMTNRASSVWAQIGNTSKAMEDTWGYGDYYTLDIPRSKLYGVGAGSKLYVRFTARNGASQTVKETWIKVKRK